MSEESVKEIAALNDRFRLRFNIPFVADEPIVAGQIVATRAVLKKPQGVARIAS